MKEDKGSLKRKKSSIDSNANSGCKQTSTLPKVTVNADTSSLLSNKRVKITDQPTDGTTLPGSMTVCEYQNPQLDQCKMTESGLSPCFKAPIEQNCTTFKESIDENILTKQSDGGTLTEINKNDTNIACIDMGIKNNCIISTEQKEKTSVILPSNDTAIEILSNVTEKSYLTVKHIPSNREIQIEFAENDTIFTLKEKIFTRFQFGNSIEDLQLKIDSKSIDTTYYECSLASWNVSPTSSITVNKKEKTKPLIKKNGLCGLRNLGNTCFMNSALQCLSNVELLTDYLLNLENVQGDVATAYYEFIQNVWSDKTLFVPKKLKNVIAHYAPQFADYDQQDAHEFMIFLLNQLHKDLKQEQQTTTIISKLFHGYADGITTCLTCKGVRRTSNMISFIPLSLDSDKKRRHFKVTFDSIHPISLSVETNANGFIEDVVETFINELQLQEKCLTEDLFERLKVISTSSNKELSFDTSLNNILDTELKFIEQDQVLRKSKIKTNSEKNSLELIDCLREFIALETPNNLWFCKNECNQPVHAAKQMLLSILPPVLIIQLKRFTENNGHMRKLDTFVNFPITGLDLNEFMIDRQEKCLYDLIAVANHMGTVSRGHYHAYARQTTTKPIQWFCFDDEHISPIDESDILSNSAYILIYVRREHEEISN
ncbi:unnamed protein product [Rotaria sp. Silwood1]|nr:unnamed protein product [Rotaria sp. Silwood1]CAF4955814.1 unnamed protein product [Rotaria sp. Silwood1]CAF4981060.1 unnamed protein product [Rotaria sp. Silwood1]CAF4982830.1 unnamed protein product [Rotaria sp. Silwood1]